MEDVILGAVIGFEKSSQKRECLSGRVDQTKTSPQKKAQVQLSFEENMQKQLQLPLNVDAIAQ